MTLTVVWSVQARNQFVATLTYIALSHRVTNVRVFGSVMHVDDTDQVLAKRSRFWQKDMTMPNVRTISSGGFHGLR